MRLQEALRLRVKDVEFASHRVVVRDAKGGRNRVTTLPVGVVPELQAHLGEVERQFRRNLDE